MTSEKINKIPSRPMIRAIPYVLAVILGVAVYARAVNGPFIWDDQVFIEDFKANPNRDIATVFTSPFISSFHGTGGSFYRPIVSLSLLLDFRLWGLRTFGYHLENLVLHALCILCVAWLAFLIFRSKTSSVAAAFLFAVHPAHSQSVAWISGRTDLFCTLFMTPALCTYILYRQSRKTGFLVLSLILSMFALMSKELAALMPILTGLTAWATGERDYRRIASEAIPYAVVVGIFFLWHGMVLAGSETLRIHVPLKLRLAIIAYSLYTHFQILLLPHTAKLGYLLTPAEIISFSTAFYGLALAVLTVSLWANRKWSRIPFFCMAWYLVTIAPVCGVPGSYSTGMVSERFVYVPSIGLALAFGWLVSLGACHEFRKLRIGSLLLAAVIVSYFAVVSINRSALYTSDIVFWKQFVRDSPRNPAGYYNLGIAYAHENQFKEALENFRTTTELAPNFKEAYYWLGRTYTELGEYDKAIESLEKALEFAPGDPTLEDALRVVYARKAKHVSPR